MHLRSISYKWLVAIAFVAGVFMDLMDATIINVALPTLAKEFHTNDTTLEWVVNGYLLSLAIWIPASGWVGDKFGTKKTFLFALVIFTLGSALCGIAWNIQSLIFFRLLQGIGGGMMTPVGTAMLFRAFPPKERASASSVMALPTALAPALGPVLGGLFVDYANWRWIFWVNVPIGIAAFLFGLKFLREHTVQGTAAFDFKGFFLSGIGLVLLLFSLSTGSSHGWTNPEVLFSGIGGIVLLAILVFVEQKSRNPLLHLRLFKDRLFRTTNIILFFANSVWIGGLFILPLFLQQLLGLSAFESGLTTFPQAVGWIVMSGFVNRLYPKLGSRKMITFGLIGVMITSLLFIFSGIHSSLWIVRTIMFMRGVFWVSAMIPIQTSTFSNITSEETGRASSLYNTNRQVSASFGVAILGTILFQLIAIQPDQLFAYHVTFTAAAVLGFIAVLFALTVRDKDAAASLGSNIVSPEPAIAGSTIHEKKIEPVLAVIEKMSEEETPGSILIKKNKNILPWNTN